MITSSDAFLPLGSCHLLAENLTLGMFAGLGASLALHLSDLPRFSFSGSVFLAFLLWGHLLTPGLLQTSLPLEASMEHSRRHYVRSPNWAGTWRAAETPYDPREVTGPCEAGSPTRPHRTRHLLSNSARSRPRPLPPLFPRTLPARRSEFRPLH